MKRQKRCMLSISANLCCRSDWSWKQHGHWWPFLKINLNCTKVVVGKWCSIPGEYSRIKVTGMIKRAQKSKPKKILRASQPTKPAFSIGLPMAQWGAWNKWEVWELKTSEKREVGIMGNERWVYLGPFVPTFLNNQLQYPQKSDQEWLGTRQWQNIKIRYPWTKN